MNYMVMAFSSDALEFVPWVETVTKPWIYVETEPCSSVCIGTVLYYVHVRYWLLPRRNFSTRAKFEFDILLLAPAILFYN